MLNKFEYTKLVSAILKDKDILTEKGLDKRAKELKKIIDEAVFIEKLYMKAGVRDDGRVNG